MGGKKVNKTTFYPPISNQPFTNIVSNPQGIKKSLTSNKNNIFSTSIKKVCLITSYGTEGAKIEFSMLLKQKGTEMIDHQCYHGSSQLGYRSGPDPPLNTRMKIRIQNLLR